MREDDQIIRDNIRAHAMTAHNGLQPTQEKQVSVSIGARSYWSMMMLKIKFALKEVANAPGSRVIVVFINAEGLTVNKDNLELIHQLHASVEIDLFVIFCQSFRA